MKPLLLVSLFLCFKVVFFTKLYVVLLQVYVIDANNVKSGLHRIQKCIPGVQYRLEIIIMAFSMP